MIYDDLWIEVDFLQDVHVDAIVTQGRVTYAQWVTSFQVQFKKNDQDQFKTIQDENDQPKVSIVIYTGMFIVALKIHSNEIILSLIL